MHSRNKNTRQNVAHFIPKHQALAWQNNDGDHNYDTNDIDNI